MRIGIARFPHKRVMKNLVGGDYILVDSLTKILIEAGHEVVKIDYKYNHKIGFLNHELFVPFFFSRRINKVIDQFDVVICDSGVNLFVKPDKCINIFQFSYMGYYQKAGNLYFKKGLSICYAVSAFFQKIGSKHGYNVSISNFLKDDLNNQGIKVNQVISNSVNCDIFKPTYFKRQNYLYAGRFDYWGKGFDVLEELAKFVKIDCVTNFKLDEGSRLRSKENVAYEKMSALYNKYRILIYPSRYESFGLVPLEAMACGVPVVMGNVGIGEDLLQEIPEFVVDGRIGNKCVTEYLSKMKLIESNYNYYCDLARKFVVKNYSFIKFRESWQELIDKIGHS